MRLHVVSLPHTQTTKDFSACAYTEKVRKFCMMMTQQSIEVILYAGEKNEAPCDELVTCISEKERAAAVGTMDYVNFPFDRFNATWVKFNSKVIEEMSKRMQVGDFICIIGGDAQKPIADAFPNTTSVEFGVGYVGTFSNYRVFESYAWMHMHYGRSGWANMGAFQGSWYDAVIPGYLDPEEFYRCADGERGDYVLFIGRMTDLKGYRLVMDVCQKLKKPLVLAGPGGNKENIKYGEYVGVVGPKKRAELMSKAYAVMAPTFYIEPFGNVIVEAQACGAPVITTDWGAFTETVEHGVTGFRCHTFGEFMQAVQDVEKLHPFSKMIRDRAIGLYGLEPISLKYKQYFERLEKALTPAWYR